MPRIELVYDSDCPNVPAARDALRTACQQAGVEPSWQEWERTDEVTPAHFRTFGSPTILIDGIDAGSDAGGASEPTAACDAASCRVYRHDDGRLHGVPSVATLAAALERTQRRPGRTGWFAAIGGGLAGLSALLPALSCPACWPAYAALLSSLGLGFVDYTPYVGPAMVLLLGAVLGTLAVDARRRRDLRSLAAGLAGAALLTVGRFAWSGGVGGALVWVGLLVMVGASLATVVRRRSSCS